MGLDLAFWVRVFDRLLPRSRAWSLVQDRPLRQLFEGLSAGPKLVQEHLSSIVLEHFPATTTKLADWSEHFGSPETLSVAELEAEWAATGGQDPRYIQDIIQAAGFDTCFVHEWWEPGSAPPVARDPIALVPTSRVLVNDIGHIEKKYDHQFGDGVSQFQGDNEIQFGAYTGYHRVPKVYPTPDDPREYPTYWYVCGETWPDFALVSEEGILTLIRLIYKLKPVHTRVILRVTAVADCDIQDVITGDEWQDVISGDEIQDVIDCPEE